jgi:hypothetical protein
MRKPRPLVCAIVLSMACFLGACSSSTTPSASNPPTAPKGIYNFQIDIANFHPIAAASGQYVLWVRQLGDSSWFSSALGSPSFIQDSQDYAGAIQLPHSPDSIVSAFVSIEAAVIPASPTSILMSGTFSGGNDSAFLSATSAGGIGDYSQAQATAIFTTKSTDTNLAKNEFYLMRFVNGVPEASCLNLPVPPAGWSYGLWVLDSNFFPLHQFFYGAFTNSYGSDIDPTNGDYPFPGGYNNAPLNDPGAALEVTLEPSFAVTGNKPAGPSPYVMLWGQLSEFIGFNDTLALQNVWSSGGPQGILHIH